MCAGLAQPSAQCLDGGLSALEVPQPEGVDDAPLRVVQPNVQVGGKGEIVAADIEGTQVEAVPGDRSLGAWVSLSTWKSDVDAGSGSRRTVRAWRVPW